MPNRPDHDRDSFACPPPRPRATPTEASDSEATRAFAAAGKTMTYLRQNSESPAEALAALGVLYAGMCHTLDLDDATAHAMLGDQLRLARTMGAKPFTYAPRPGGSG